MVKVVLLDQFVDGEVLSVALEPNALAATQDGYIIIACPDTALHIYHTSNARQCIGKIRTHGTPVEVIYSEASDTIAAIEQTPAQVFS